MLLYDLGRYLGTNPPGRMRLMAWAEISLAGLAQSACHVVNPASLGGLFVLTRLLYLLHRWPFEPALLLALELRSPSRIERAEGTLWHAWQTCWSTHHASWCISLIGCIGVAWAWGLSRFCHMIMDNICISHVQVMVIPDQQKIQCVCICGGCYGILYMPTVHSF